MEKQWKKDFSKLINNSVYGKKKIHCIKPVLRMKKKQKDCFENFLSITQLLKTKYY